MIVYCRMGADWGGDLPGNDSLACCGASDAQ